MKYALASLNNQGGNLGAVQQALSANINNLNTTSQNLTSALGVVQDANIPAVANQMTEADNPGAVRCGRVEKLDPDAAVLPLAAAVISCSGRPGVHPGRRLFVAINTAKQGEA